MNALNRVLPLLLRDLPRLIKGWLNGFNNFD